jgi:hypothetical protein
MTSLAPWARAVTMEEVAKRMSSTTTTLASRRWASSSSFFSRTWILAISRPSFPLGTAGFIRAKTPLPVMITRSPQTSVQLA